jgi:hypothetical protein
MSDELILPELEPQMTSEQRVLRTMIPDGAYSVLVRTEKDELKYRLISELSELDVIQVTLSGIPNVMMSKPGRREKPTMRPVNDKVAEMNRFKDEITENDPILEALRKDANSHNVLEQVILQIGEEAASLRFERLDKERKGEDTSHTSIRRIAALKAIGDSWLKRKDQLVHQEVDLDGAGFKALMTFIFETFRDAMQSADCRDELIETIFLKVAKKMGESWKTAARKKMAAAV